MRIMVFGRGVIGTIYGYVLHAAGNEVIHFVRPGRANQFARGVHIRLLDGRESQQTEYEVDYPIQVTERLSPHDGFDLYLVSVRHYQPPSILPLVAANAGTADVLFFNNLWTGPKPIDAALPRSTYLWGFPTAGGGFIDGMLDVALLGDIHLGEIDGTRSPRLARIAGVFQNARVASDVRTDIVHWEWVHFAINAGVVGTALKVGSASALLDDSAALEQAVLAVRDALEVCRARGVDIDHSEDAAPFFGPVEQVAAGIQALYQQNRAARKIMECHTAVDDLVHIYQDVLVTGRALGVDMPHGGAGASRWCQAADCGLGDAPGVNRKDSGRIADSSQRLISMSSTQASANAARKDSRTPATLQ